MAATIGSDADTGTCSSDPVFLVEHSWGSAAKAAGVWLEKDSAKIYQGKTDDQGEITVLGAADGDKVVVELWGVDLFTSSAQVSCSSMQSNPATSSAKTVLVLEQAPFSMNISVAPSIMGNHADVRVQASTVLGGAPHVEVLQSGSITPTGVSMIYEASTDTFIGACPLDANLAQSGNVEANAVDTGGHPLQTFTTFNLSEVTANEDITIFSADGQVELYLPAGSLSANGRLSIVPDSSSGMPPDGLVTLSGPYSVQAEEGITLIDSAGITMKYLDSGGTLRHANLSTARIYHWNDSESQWVPMASEVFADHGAVSASTSAWGIYAAMAERQYSVYLPLILRTS